MGCDGVAVLLPSLAHRPFDLIRSDGAMDLSKSLAHATGCERPPDHPKKIKSIGHGL